MTGLRRKAGACGTLAPCARPEPVMVCGANAGNPAILQGMDAGGRAGRGVRQTILRANGRPPAKLGILLASRLAATSVGHEDALGRHDFSRGRLRPQPFVPGRRPRAGGTAHLGRHLAVRRHDGDRDRRRPDLRLDRAGGGRAAHDHPCRRAAARSPGLQLRPAARGRPALQLRHRQAGRPRRLHQRRGLGDDLAADRVRSHRPACAPGAHPLRRSHPDRRPGAAGEHCLRLAARRRARPRTWSWSHPSRPRA